jgi:hypothetical protein
MICEKRYHKGEPDISYPAVFCDVCGLRIKKSSDGNAFWYPNYKANEEDFYEQKNSIVFNHKECPFEIEMPTGSSEASQELREFIQYLAVSLGMASFDSRPIKIAPPKNKEIERLRAENAKLKAQVKALQERQKSESCAMCGRCANSIFGDGFNTDHEIAAFTE